MFGHLQHVESIQDSRKNFYRKLRTLALLLCMALTGILSCRKHEETIVPPEITPVAPETPGTQTPVKGFFLLNEGNMGSNKATLDWFDCETGEYSKNIYPQRNPGVVKELGDTGNDLKIYGSKLYAVINGSHLVEVMDAETAQHIATIPIPNCRYITFAEGYAYVSSFAGEVQLDPVSRLGYIAKIDTATLAEVARCTTGYQPEEMAVRSGKLYVANSGGYRVPNYDNTVSVIDLETFKEEKKITVAINLHRMQPDTRGNIWITSRGNYGSTPAGTYTIDTLDAVTPIPNLPAGTYTIDTLDAVTPIPNLPVGNITICGDSLYTCGTTWNHATGATTTSYAIVNTQTKTIVSHNFITDGTDKTIQTPYGIAVNPQTHEIYITDAKNHVTPGTLYCFTPEGKKKWEVTTGDIPAHIAFAHKKLK